MPRIVTLVAAVGMVALVLAPASASSAAGTLDLRGVLSMVSMDALCPPGMSASTSCHTRTARGGVSGLGDVTQMYMFNGDPAPCPGTVKVLGYTTSFKVGDKGEIDFAVADAPNCLVDTAALTATQSFTVTGGTGIYAGASGGGRIERAASFTGGGASGSDTWIGTLVVPGVEFDLTAPVLSGATSKTVRAPKGAKRVRVTYRVTASDAVEGPVHATCEPRSGSRFPIGRTVVRCFTSDSSANTANASFRVTVRSTR